MSERRDESMPIGDGPDATRRINGGATVVTGTRVIGLPLFRLFFALEEHPRAARVALAGRVVRGCIP